MSGISFAHPLILIAVLAVPVAFGTWLVGVRRGMRRAASLARHSPSRPPYFAAGCMAAAAAVTIVAAAQPRWGEAESEIPRKGAELVVVLDVSRSMDSRDVAPSRLQAAKTALATTLNRLDGDRVALVIFAGSARLRFPLTADITAAKTVISGLETGSVLVQGGSSSSLGLDVAMGAFSGEDTGRLMLLITDGDDLGADPAGSAARVRNAGIDLMVAGVGTGGGGTVPIFDPKSKSTVDKPGAGGQPLVTKLNEPFLRALAVAAGGRYLGSDPGVIPGAVAGRLDALKRTRIDERPAKIPVERFPVFTAIALGLVVLASVAEAIPRTMRTRPAWLVAAVASGLLLSGCASQAYEANEHARAAMAAGDTDRAIGLFQEALASEPREPQVALNLAAALHAAGRYDEAIQAARRLTNLPGAETRAKGYASIGHHQFAAGRLDDALDAFRHALLESPGNDAARHDYEVVYRLLHPAQPGDQGSQGQQQPTPSPTAGGGQPGGQDGGTPGATPGQGDGGGATPSATPGQSTGGQQGAQPGNGGQQPGGSPGALPTSPEALDRQLADIDQRVQALIREAGETPTASQALQILQLLAERNRVAARRDALSGGGDPNDY